MLPRSLEGMVDVKSRRCAAEGCNKYPAFNVPGESTARYCGDHRRARQALLFWQAGLDMTPHAVGASSIFWQLGCT
jgi:hypothetical protein